jgi:MFS family permease
VQEGRAASWAALLEPSHAVSATVVVLGILAPAFSSFITATVLPTALAEIGGLGLYAWASTAYAVTSILGSAGCSVLLRKAGTRGAVVIAAILFVLGAAACGAAPSMPVIIAGRGLQGVGGGMMIAAVHRVVREVFPEELWPRMLATISGAWGIAALGGPAVGGILAGRGAWRVAFWAVAPMAVVTAVLTWRILHSSETDGAPGSRVPLGRLLLICVSVLCVGSVANAGSTVARAELLAGAVISIVLTFRLDGAARVRLFPSGMLSLGGRVGKGFWMIFLLAMATTPGGVFIALLVQVLHGVSPAVAGYLYAGQALSWTIAALLSARLAGHRVRVALVLGPALTAAGFAGLFTTIASGPVAAIAASVALVGGGIGTCWAHIGTVVLASGRHDEGAVTAAMIPSTQLFAVALGSALSGVIASAAGLSDGASKPVAALAGAWLFGSFVLAPLGALVIASRLGLAAHAGAAVSSAAR